MDDELIAAHGELGALMPYLHLPVQSGPTIFRQMNQRTPPTTICGSLIACARRSRTQPLSSDFIVGFERGQADFDATMALIDASASLGVRSNGSPRHAGAEA
jgi:tRNA-2-methylthio-N6-dimethylallyladenosine synthase